MSSPVILIHQPNSCVHSSVCRARMLPCSVELGAFIAVADDFTVTWMQRPDGGSLLHAVTCTRQRQWRCWCEHCYARSKVQFWSDNLSRFHCASSIAIPQHDFQCDSNFVETTGTIDSFNSAKSEHSCLPTNRLSIAAHSAVGCAEIGCHLHTCCRHFVMDLDADYGLGLGDRRSPEGECSRRLLFVNVGSQ